MYFIFFTKLVPNTLIFTPQFLWMKSSPFRTCVSAVVPFLREASGARAASSLAFAVTHLKKSAVC